MYNEFERLLEEGAPLEAYSEWLEAMVERCVLLGARKSKAPVHKVAHAFLLTWSCFGTRVIRDMTLHSAPSFGKWLTVLLWMGGSRVRPVFRNALLSHHDYFPKSYIDE